MNIEQPNLNPNPEEEKESEEQDETTNENNVEQLKVKNTTDFQAAVERGELERAENFLDEAKNNREDYEQYDDRWIDHRERELFKAYYSKEDWTGAKRIVESSVKDESKEGRKKRLEQLSGMKYEEI